MEYYSALKKKKILTHAITWVNLEDIMLREMCQSQKTNKYCMTPLTWGTWYSQIQRKQNGGCQSLGGGRDGELFNLAQSCSSVS